MNKIQRSTTEIRSLFLDFFRDRDHHAVSSSPLVPANDPTLLFTNAGMVQFKELFLGLESRDYRRAVSSQRCVRAGGKHNDLDQVGYTARHHTFFEMLGNFSFGDYFKQEAIAFAWTFLTEELALPAEKLWVTVFEEDDEAERIWLEQIGIAPERCTRIGAKDNFWAMGDTGPCGPCTEIFYDHGPQVEGGPPGTPDEDGDRFVEIWNLVFMQYDRGTDGELRPLPKPCVDTGMGLERLAAVIQGVHSNYETDLFRALISAAAELTGSDDMGSASLRVIADHIRACAFLVIDGVLPGNEGRGYVLRRIIRRACRHGHKLGQLAPFFSQMVASLVVEMGGAYPELVAKQAQVTKILAREEERFALTLDKGLKLLEGALASLDGNEIPGEIVFKLYDTYGFPDDLTGDIARERGLTIDEPGFARLMEEQRNRARSASQFESGGHIDTNALANLPATRFEGYHELEFDGAVVLFLSTESGAVEQLKAGERGTAILDRTTFYAESGGQMGDQGWLRSSKMQATVSDTPKVGGVLHAHEVTVTEGTLRVGAKVTTAVDGDLRARIVLNHSATHLMHAALRDLLGDHVEQKGSMVSAQRLRFDFSHPEPVSRSQLQQVERVVNQEIRANRRGKTELMSFDDAVATGAMALFGEKYGDQVRVVRFGDYSVELCGGTHVNRSGDIGLFRIVSESGIAAGVRRIEAITGDDALLSVTRADNQLMGLAETLKAGPADSGEKLQALLERSRSTEKELLRLRAKMASQAGGDLAASAIEVAGIKVIAAEIPNADNKALAGMMDQLKNSLGECAVVLASVNAGKVMLIAGVSKGLTARLGAGELVNSVAEKVGGRGGGRPDMARAGGNKPEALPGALKGVAGWVEEKLEISG